VWHHSTPNYSLARAVSQLPLLAAFSRVSLPEGTLWSQQPVNSGLKRSQQWLPIMAPCLRLCPHSQQPPPGPRGSYPLAPLCCCSVYIPSICSLTVIASNSQQPVKIKTSDAYNSAIRFISVIQTPKKCLHNKLRAN